MKTTHSQRISALGYGICLTFGAVGTGCIDTPESGDHEAVLSSQISLDTGASYTLVGVQSKKCVGVVDNSTASEARFEIRTCAGIASQRFRPERMFGGFFRMRNELSGLCMDVRGVSQSDGAEIIQFACSNGANQQWSFTDLASGADRLTARHSGKVLDVFLQATGDGTLLEQWSSNGGANQQFTVIQALPALVP